MNHAHIYKISRNYSQVTLWVGSRLTYSRVAVHTCKPNKGLSRKERWEVITSWLYGNFKIAGPCYRQTDNK